MSTGLERRYRRVLRPRAVAAALATAGVLVLAGACSSGPGSSPGRSPAAPTVGAAEAACRHLTAAACYTPQLFRVAYGIQPLLDRGIDGRGQTVVLMEFAKSPQQPEPRQSVPDATDIRQDLALFDAVFGLPAGRLQVDNGIADSTSPWLASSEEVEDAEIVHAVAPDAAIRVILIPPQSSPGSAVAAVDAVLRLALSQGAVVSIGPGSAEHCYTSAEVAGLNSALQAADKHHVTVVASSGDLGAANTACTGGAPVSRGVGLFAADPLVLAAGGTSLDADGATGAYISETAWNTPSAGPVASPASGGAVPSPGPSTPSGGIPEASGGGFSQLFPRPAYQDGVPGIGTARGVPDVAADADPATGMTLALTNEAGEHVFFSAAGTSAAGPLWAALIALADQYAGRHLGLVNPAIYRIGRSAYYHQAFHDIITGNNTVRFPHTTVTGYQALPGWDPVTGFGSPNAQALIPLLTRYTSP